jgi:hypothetical protein
LAEGTYGWATTDGLLEDEVSRRIDIRRATYTWKDCLGRWERASYLGETDHFVYVHDSTLTGPWGTATLRNWLQPPNGAPATGQSSIPSATVVTYN